MSIETKERAIVELSANTYNTAITFPAVSATPPVTAAASGLATFACGRKNRMSFSYGGTAATKTYQRYYVGWQETKDTNGVSVYVPFYLGSGQVILGSKAMGSVGANIESAAAVWADELVDDGNSPFLTVVSPAGNTIAEDILDVSRFEFVSVYVSRKNESSPADTMTVIGALYDAVGGGVGSQTAGESAESPAAKTIVEANQMVATPTTSEAIVGSVTFCRAIWFQARRANAANTGNIYLNVGTAPGDLSANHMKMMEPDDHWEMPIPQGIKIDLNTIYVDSVTATDGVIFGYIPV